MDYAAREVLITILQRLRYMEKTRHDDMASLKALIMVLCAGNPEFLKRYRELKQRELDTLTAPVHNLDDVYDGLIALLRNPDPPAEDEREKLRRLLESFEGPKQ